MDQRERMNPFEEAIKAAIDGRLARLWTAIPGIINSFDPDKTTATVQPVIQAQQRLPDGSTKALTLPLLLDCPVIFPGGGGHTLTFPIQNGDECLVLFSARCIDGWWQTGDVSPQAELRMHDLSDGFVLVGPHSTPNTIGDISTTTTQLRADDGSTVIELDGPNQKVTITAPGGAVIDANTTINGNLHVTGTITGDTDVVTGTISLKNHKHGGVQPGGAQTGGPV